MKPTPPTPNASNSQPVGRRHRQVTFHGLPRVVARKPLAPESTAPVVGARALPADLDLERMLTTDGTFCAKRAQVHPFAARRTLRIMTDTSPYNRMNGILFDVAELNNIPPKMNLRDLSEWEKAQHELPNAEGRSAEQSTPVSESDLYNESLREDTRTYAQLLDLYSMHEFIVRKGVTLRNTPEFASFKRRYVACWGNVELVIRKIEEFLTSYGVDIAFIDGKKVATLAAYQVDDILSREDLLGCLVNREEVEPLTSSAAQQYAHGNRGRDLAAQKIQATWRMYLQRIAYRHLQVGTRAAILIQRKWALNRSHCTTQKTIKTLRDARLLRWKRTMEEFTRRWPIIKEGRRTVVHLPSLSYPRFHAKRVPFYFAQQMGQLTRVADLRDPNVDIVMLAPFRPETEVLEYYFTLLEDAGVANPRDRVVLLVPEDTRRLPMHLSLTRLALLSARLMKCLSALCKGRCAYVVPGVVGPEELSFAIELNIPMLCADPTIAQAFGTKSGAQRILDLAEVHKPLGVHSLRNVSELMQSLAALMIKHREVTRWLVKLETESCSRGHVYFDVNRIRVLRSEDESQKTYENVLAELEAHAGKRARLVHPHSYPDWELYVETFNLVGGTVEAVPNRVQASITANLFIEPTGAVALESVQEPMLAPAYTIMGCRFPVQPSLPYEAVRDAALSVGRAAFRRRIIGYISVDFVVYEPHATGTGDEDAALRICAVDVDLCLSNNAAAHKFVSLITNSRWDVSTGMCVVGDIKHTLSYAYSGIIHCPSIAAVRHSQFFSLCRARGLSFDRKRRTGIIFHLVDVLLRGCLGVLSVGTHKSLVTKTMKEFQNLLNLELPKQSEHSAESNFVYFSSAIHQLVRSRSKNNETKTM